jgi:hypothetical protein
MHQNFYTKKFLLKKKPKTNHGPKYLLFFEAERDSVLG